MARSPDTRGRCPAPVPSPASLRHARRRRFRKKCREIRRQRRKFPIVDLGSLDHQIRKIESAEIERNTLPTGLSLSRASREATKAACARSSAARVSLGCRRINIVGIEADLVVNLALLGIAENVVGLGERLEFLLRGLVPGIDVRMVLARQLAKRLANLVRCGGFLYAQDLVIVFFGCCRHQNASSISRVSWAACRLPLVTRAGDGRPPCRGRRESASGRSASKPSLPIRCRRHRRSESMFDRLPENPFLPPRTLRP